VVEPLFIVIDKYTGGYVHGVTEKQSFFDAALRQARFNVGGDIDKRPPAWNLKPQLFPVTFHLKLPPSNKLYSNRG
jgi:hypothetical protein